MNRLQRLAAIVRVLPRLGWMNLARAAMYRLQVRSGYFRRTLPIGSGYVGPFWQWSTQAPAPAPVDAHTRAWIGAQAEQVLGGTLMFYSSQAVAVGFPPRWQPEHHGAAGTDAMRHWSLGADATPGQDIKWVWEPSRFDGLLTLAAAMSAAPQARLADGIEQWMSAWVRDNPANAGANWQCAQETSLRLLHTVVADALMTDARVAQRSAALERFVREHCARIAATMHYATAQDNNHATSEAVALFVGGAWLGQGADAARWMARGRAHLERCVARLVMADGTFAQYSVNYHRLFLDTLCVAEWFRRRIGADAFSAALLERARAATDWLRHFVDASSGDAPNIGANDGARLLQIASPEYRDYRPSVQLAAALFWNARAYDAMAADRLCTWLGVARADALMPAIKSRLFDIGGYAVLVRNEVRAYLRVPRFRFRPSQADAMHVDVWFGSDNVMRDAGSFLYNTEPRWMAYFPGVEAHNTVQFDDRAQMPRLSRFLLGDWLTADLASMNAAADSVECAYTDRNGARHHRVVTLTESGVAVRDSISGFGHAVLRWRLAPATWIRTGATYASPLACVTIAADPPTSPAELTEAWESREYASRSALPMIALHVDAGPCTLNTFIERP